MFKLWIGWYSFAINDAENALVFQIMYTAPSENAADLNHWNKIWGFQFLLYPDDLLLNVIWATEI